jgi:hypothetical protein
MRTMVDAKLRELCARALNETDVEKLCKLLGQIDGCMAEIIRDVEKLNRYAERVLSEAPGSHCVQ